MVMSLMPVSARSTLSATVLCLAITLLLAPGAGSGADRSSGSCREPSSLAAILAVPEARRARCFASRPITFQAWGWDQFNTWPGLRLPGAWVGRDFVLATKLGSDSLSVFLPRSVALPDRAGTPWEHRDGIAPGDAWWRVTGHFDDPLAAECVPAPDDTNDGVPVLKSAGEVLAFCRNHFVVDRLVWLRAGPPDTAIGSVDPSGSPISHGGPDWLLVSLGAFVFMGLLRWPPARGSGGRSGSS
jgi:hypothetical protein